MQEFLSHLLQLHRERDWARAARRCGITPDALAASVAAANREYGQPLVHPGEPFQGFTPAGEQVVAWARQFQSGVEALKLSLSAARRRDAVAPLRARRSVSPKRLALPGPDAQDLDLMVGAALSAPDHAGLRPWRFIVFTQEQRAPLADLFEQEKLRRDPLAPRADLLRAREHATRAPTLLAFVVSPRAGGLVPVREQWLAAGAALGNLLNAAHQLGFGAIVLSGDRCFDAQLQAALGLAPSECLAGFVSLGSILAPPPPRRPEALDAVRSVWVPGAAAQGMPPARSVDGQPAGKPG